MRSINGSNGGIPRPPGTPGPRGSSPPENGSGAAIGGRHYGEPHPSLTHALSHSSPELKHHADFLSRLLAATPSYMTPDGMTNFSSLTGAPNPTAPGAMNPPPGFFSDWLRRLVSKPANGSMPNSASSLNSNSSSNALNNNNNNNNNSINANNNNNNNNNGTGSANLDGHPTDGKDLISPTRRRKRSRVTDHPSHHHSSSGVKDSDSPRIRGHTPTSSSTHLISPPTSSPITAHPSLGSSPTSVPTSTGSSAAATAAAAAAAAAALHPFGTHPLWFLPPFLPNPYMAGMPSFPNPPTYPSATGGMNSPHHHSSAAAAAAAAAATSSTNLASANLNTRENLAAAAAAYFGTSSDFFRQHSNQFLNLNQNAPIPNHHSPHLMPPFLSPDLNKQANGRTSSSSSCSNPAIDDIHSPINGPSPKKAKVSPTCATGSAGSSNNRNHNQSPTSSNINNNTTTTNNPSNNSSSASSKKKCSSFSISRLTSPSPSNRHENQYSGNKGMNKLSDTYNTSISTSPSIPMGFNSTTTIGKGGSEEECVDLRVSGRNVEYKKEPSKPISAFSDPTEVNLSHIKIKSDASISTKYVVENLDRIYRRIRPLGKVSHATATGTSHVGVPPTPNSPNISAQPSASIYNDQEDKALASSSSNKSTPTINQILHNGPQLLHRSSHHHIHSHHHVPHHPPPPPHQPRSSSTLSNCSTSSNSSSCSSSNNSSIILNTPSKKSLAAATAKSLNPNFVSSETNRPTTPGDHHEPIAHEDEERELSSACGRKPSSTPPNPPTSSKDETINNTKSSNYLINSTMNSGGGSGYTHGASTVVVSNSSSVISAKDSERLFDLVKQRHCDLRKAGNISELVDLEHTSSSTTPHPLPSNRLIQNNEGDESNHENNKNPYKFIKTCDDKHNGNEDDDFVNVLSDEDSDQDNELNGAPVPSP